MVKPTSKFFVPVHIYPPNEIGGRHIFVVSEDFEFNGVTIPKGFSCDAASAPILRQRAILAAIKHDWEYHLLRQKSDAWEKEGIYEKMDGHFRMLRKMVDMEFKTNMRKYDKAHGWLMSTFYKAVRWFGRSSAK